MMEISRIPLVLESCLYIKNVHKKFLLDRLGALFKAEDTTRAF